MCFRFARPAVAGALVASVLYACSGCATLLNSDTQPVTFTSEPEGAVVRIDGVAYGRTPVTIPVLRKGWDKQISISMDGYKTENFTLKNTLSGSTFLNVIWWPGAIVDGISGRGGKYQSHVQVVLEPGTGINNRDEMSNEAVGASEAQ